MVQLSAQRTFDITIADSTYHMKQYWFVLYSGGEGAPLDSLTAARSQEEHLAHQAAQAERGLIVMGGPFGKNDADWRGILLYDCDTREEVEGYLKQGHVRESRPLELRHQAVVGYHGTRFP